MHRIINIISVAAALWLAVSAHVSAAEPYAVVTVPVANLRDEPRHGAEMVSQAIMGTPLRVEAVQGQWYTVCMPDGYRGYMIDNSLTPMDAASFDRWRSSPRAVVSAMDVKVYASPGNTGAVVTPLQLADVVETADTVAGQVKVILPDGRSGYADSSAFSPFRPFGHSAADAAAAIIGRGMQLVGQEYMWGGTSVKANDCSGLTRVLYQSEGIYLPRDAWQQALAGEPVDAGNLLPGDLIFFTNAKGRVNHVGIYAGGGMMLHCSGRVRTDRILPGGKEKTYHLTPAFYRRVITGKPLQSDIEANKIYFE